MRTREAIGHILHGNCPNVWIQAVRYCISGAVAFVCDASVLYVLTSYVGMHYLLSSVCSFAVGVTITYLLSILWVFDHRRMRSRGVELAVFVLINLVGLGLTQLLMWTLTDLCGLFYMLSKVATTVLVTGWNFVAKKYILFTAPAAGND